MEKVAGWEREASPAGPHPTAAEQGIPCACRTEWAAHLQWLMPMRTHTFPVSSQKPTRVMAWEASYRQCPEVHQVAHETRMCQCISERTRFTAEFLFISSASSVHRGAIRFSWSLCMITGEFPADQRRSTTAHGANRRFSCT